MTLESAGLPRSLQYCMALGGILLAVGGILLANENRLAAWGLDAGPLGANLVVAGTVLAAWALWLSWRWMSGPIRRSLAGLLLAAGVGLWLLSGWFEPLLTRVVAVAAIVSGVAGAVRSFGDVLPRIDHSGAMPLSEKLAIVSLLANGMIVSYLLVRSRGIAVDAAGGVQPDLTTLMTTVVVIVLILLAESLGLRVLRGKDAGASLEDERDIAIRDAAGRTAYLAVVVGVVFLATQLGLGDLSERTAEANAGLGLSTPLGLAHVLIAVLFLSQCARSLAEIWQYQRARF